MEQGGGGGSQSQYGAPPPQPADITPPTTAALTTHTLLGATDPPQHLQVVEEASPISSRPPATATTSSAAAAAANLDEFMRLSVSGADEDALAAAGEEAHRAGGIASGNRWPRQETLALLQTRSEMDAAFRDAILKGPLWEDVSRKLAEHGYMRSAKKCKEKFENVHKYYKRTKEGRAGRQDGKSYRFFSQLEALHNTSTASAANINVSPIQSTPPATSGLDVAPVSVGIPMPISSSVRITPPHHPHPPSSTAPLASSTFHPHLASTMRPSAPPTATSIGISFSSNESSSSPSSDKDDDDHDEDLEVQPTNLAAGSSGKRKRQSPSPKGDTRRMMDFFEELMKQVMQKQEIMQQRFLEAIEKREQDRMMREEAWKRQEVARLSREHELMAQERAISASRDAAIVAFLQKITGQSIQLPSPVAIPAVSQPPPPPQPQAAPIASIVTASALPQPQQASQQRQQERQRQQIQHRQYQHHQVHHHQSPISSDVVMAVPEQQLPPSHEMGSSGSLEPASSRWPKAEVLALIKFRSGLESRYQETGPKGPLWGEISAGMQRMGYKRNAKRCKEKWENINKYFKKVKESNKKRPEDAKTCPYFHELDALHRKKILGSSSGGGGSTSASGFSNQTRLEEQQQKQENSKLGPLAPSITEERSNVPSVIEAQQLPSQASESQNKSGGGIHLLASNSGFPGSLFGDGNGGAARKPEDIVKELMTQQATQNQGQQQLKVNEYDRMEEVDCDNLDHEEDEDEEEEDGEDYDDEEDEELQEESKMAYKIEFQRQNTSASNGGGNGAPSFLAMVQ